VGAVKGRANIQWLNAAAPAPVQPPAEISVPTAFTHREIQARVDRVQGALALSPIRTPAVVNSLDGYAFFVTGPDAESLVRSVRDALPLSLGDASITVIPVAGLSSWA
jgi:hypothetical protein